jgi:hypothetical protein
MKRYLAVAGMMYSQAMLANPIYLQPGQCIVVGSQQVCAIKPDATSTTSVASEKTLYACRYGQFKDADVTNVKTYELVQVLFKPDGSKTEVELKNFGINGKDACEKEAEKRDSKK